MIDMKDKLIIPPLNIFIDDTAKEAIKDIQNSVDNLRLSHSRDHVVNPLNPSSLGPLKDHFKKYPPANSRCIINPIKTEPIYGPSPLNEIMAILDHFPEEAIPKPLHIKLDYPITPTALACGCTDTTVYENCKFKHKPKSI